MNVYGVLVAYCDYDIAYNFELLSNEWHFYLGENITEEDAIDYALNQIAKTTTIRKSDLRYLLNWHFQTFMDN